jgi:hypothetical protein
VNVVTDEERRMKDALTKVLVGLDRDDASVDRIMAASFFRPRPMQAGTTAPVIRLDERRATSARPS